MKLLPPEELQKRLAALPDDQRAEAEKLLANLQRIYEDNPLLRFQPNPAPSGGASQADYLAIDTNIGALFCGNRFGKTAVGLVWDLIQVCRKESIPEHLRPYKRWDVEEHGPIRGRIVAPKFNENIEQVILPELRKWAPKAELLGGSFDEAFRKQQRVLEFANGSSIQFLTFDQDLDAHAGAARHFIHFDEEPEGEKGLQMFHENMTRLADFNGDFRLTMTPLFGLSWAFDEIWLARLTDPDITALQGDSYDNPHVDHRRLRKDEKRMTEEERRARRQGEFVHFAGQFYPEFGDKHRVDPPAASDIREQNIVVGIDPGLNYTGVVWVAFDNDNIAQVFAEAKPEQMVVEDVARVIRETNALWGIEPDYYVIDPSARNRSTINAEAIESAYLRAGIPTIRGQNDRAAGILEVKRRLQHGPGLFVSKDCPAIALEFARYRRDPNSQDEFAAVKKDDHLLDALRYVCLGRAWDAPNSSEPEPYGDRWKPGTAPPPEWFDDQRNTHPLGEMV